jgi:methylglyoxal synthase
LGVLQIVTKTLNIGLVAHDAMKEKLAEWAAAHSDKLVRHNLYGTGTTSSVLVTSVPDLKITALKSGPLGGDQQLGAMICDGKLDMLIFFQDVMTSQPHDVDVKALIRMSTLYDIPIACNVATANLIVKSL